MIRLKAGLLFFWAAWMTVVTASNVCDGLKALDVLDKGWPFVSGNYQLVAKAAALYPMTRGAGGVLFTAVIAWEGLSALLFLIAGLTFRGRAALGPVRPAFGVGLALWAAFMLADEIFLQYGVEGTHMRIFIAQVATLLVVALVPDSETPT